MTREQRRNLAAEKTCQALRAMIGKPQCEVTKDDWDLTMGHLLNWMKFCGKRRAYVIPKAIPKRNSEKNHGSS